MRDLDGCLAVVSTPRVSPMIIPGESRQPVSSSGVPIRILRITPPGSKPGVLVSVVGLAVLPSANQAWLLGRPVMVYCHLVG